MRSYTLIALATLAILILSSCAGFNQIQRPATIPDIRVGHTALSATFMENAPPSRVKGGVEVPIYYDLRNVGAADIDRGYYRIIGNDPTIIYIEPAYGAFSLGGKTLSNPIGERTVLQLKGSTTQLNEQQHKMPAYFETEFCFPYETATAIQVCIDTDYTDSREEFKTCTPRTYTGSGQGGPIAITKVETHKPLPPSPDVTDRVVPSFTITLRDLGGGEVIRTDEVADYCSDFFATIHRDVINANVRLSDLPLTCTLGDGEFGESIEGEVELSERKKDVVLECRLPSGIPTRAGTYLAPLQIKLNYGYVQKLSKTLTITR